MHGWLPRSGLTQMTPEQLRTYQAEIVGIEPGSHGRLAVLLGVSEIGIKRFATGARPIPEYVAQSIRAMVLLHRAGKITELHKLS